MLDGLFGDILGAGASVVSGGVTALLGVGVKSLFGWLNARIELAKLKLQYDNEQTLRRIDAEIVDKEWAGRIKTAEAEAQGARDTANAAAFAESYKLEPQRYAEGQRPDGFWGAFGWFLLALVDVARGLVRPWLTVYLCVLVTLIYVQARGLVAKEDLSAEQALALTFRIVDTILYLATTCVLWWFGTRNDERPPLPAAGRVRA